MLLEIEIDLSRPKYCEHLVPVTREAYERHKGERCRRCRRLFKPVTAWWEELIAIVE